MGEIILLAFAFLLALGVLGMTISVLWDMIRVHPGGGGPI